MSDKKRNRGIERKERSRKGNFAWDRLWHFCRLCERGHKVEGIIEEMRP